MHNQAVTGSRSPLVVQISALARDGIYGFVAVPCLVVTPGGGREKREGHSSHQTQEWLLIHCGISGEVVDAPVAQETIGSCFMLTDIVVVTELACTERERPAGRKESRATRSSFLWHLHNSSN